MKIVISFLIFLSAATVNAESYGERKANFDAGCEGARSAILHFAARISFGSIGTDHEGYFDLSNGDACKAELQSGGKAVVTCFDRALTRKGALVEGLPIINAKCELVKSESRVTVKWSN